MPPSSDSSSSQDDVPTVKYQFSYNAFIFYALLTSFCLFFVFLFILFLMHSQFSSNHLFNSEFYDSSGINTQTMIWLLKYRSNIYDDQLVIKELEHVDLDKVSETAKAAIQKEIMDKTNTMNATIKDCNFNELFWTTHLTKNIKSVLGTQKQSINLVFKIYVPLSLFLLLAILVAFVEARKSSLTMDQRKCFKLFAIFFACHAFVHILIVYSVIYDNSKNFKANEIPSICTNEDPTLTDDCYINDKNCLEIFSLPEMAYGRGALTLINYIFWQILLFVILGILMVFGEGRSTTRDGYEEV